MDTSQLSPNYVIPIGTQVVLRKDLPVMGAVFDTDGEHVFKKSGSVGVVIEAPLIQEYTYLVRFPDEHTVRAKKADLAVRRTEAPEDWLPNREMALYESYVIYKVRMGSRAFGLSDETSDTDERGVYLPPADWHWSMQPLPEQLEFKRTADGLVLDHNSPADADDFCWWEIEKFLRLALKANPNVLEALYVPEQHILFIDEMGQQLRDLRGLFLSKLIYQTYSGYVLSQFKKMKRAVETGETFRPKHAMHLIRLLYSGIEAMRGQGILVEVGAYRDELLRIKQGGVPFDEIHKQAIALSATMQTEFDRTTLPDRPDVAAVDRFLIEARRSRT
ncbi:MAG: nucleotidyltransferase domain-containing protein [Planctomycetota bacterium]